MAPIDRLGKYQLLEQIRYGSLGRLYKAQDPLLKRVVALKVLLEEGLDEDVRARFFTEARASAKLSHPNIITVYDVGEDQGRLFVVMEHVEGEGLDALIRRRAEISLEVKLSTMLQICRGLGYAHRQGVVHADLKPGNVMVLQDGTVKLLDFGLARIAATAQTSMTLAAMTAANALYWAPERGRTRGDRRADIFSAGALFYALTASATASVAPGAPSLFAPDPSIPVDLAAVLERAMCREPDERYKDMAAMESALVAVDDRLRGEAHALRRRIAATAADLQQLHAELAERLGGAPTAVSTPPGDATPLSALEARWRDLQGEATRARAQLDRVAAWRPVYEAAIAHERAGDFAAAVEAFERVVGAMPEHAAAVEGLARARPRRVEVEPRPPAPRAVPAPSAASSAASSAETALSAETVPAPEASPAPDAGSPTVFGPPGAPVPAPATVGRTLPLLPVAPEAAGASEEAARGAAAPARGATGRRRASRARRSAVAVAIALVFLAGGGAVYWQVLARAEARQRADLDVARGQLAEARAAADAANAALLSPDQFADALAFDRVQRDLAEARQWREAIVSARAAAQAYADAARHAGGAARTAADDARARMQADKRRGARGVADYDQGLVQEQQGERHYAAGRFPDAAQSFLAAARLFGQSGRTAVAPSAPPVTSAVPAPAASAPVTVSEPDAEIRDVLRSYARAFETKDLDLLQRIRLAMGPDEVSRHRSVFAQTRSYRIGLQIDRIVVRGDEAEVRGRREDTIVTSSGETIRTPGDFRFALRKVGERWRIERVR